MKTSLLLAASLVSAQILCAQNVVSSGTTSVRDGFTLSGTSVLFTRDGVSKKVEQEIVMKDGMRVRPDGSVLFANGNKASLRNNQLLTLTGTFEDAALTPQGTAPVTSGGPPITNHGRDVGIAAADGVSVSGADTLVTRNGVTQRLDKELKLTNGARVQPDGSVILADGQKISLRADQVLTFEGALVEPVPRPNAAPTALDGIVVHDGRAYLLRGGRAFLIDAALVPDGQMLTNTGSLVPLKPGLEFSQTPPAGAGEAPRKAPAAGEGTGILKYNGTNPAPREAAPGVTREPLRQ